MKKKLEKEIESHAEAEKKAKDIGSKLKEHHSVVSKALQDTKRYRQENKESDSCTKTQHDEYEAQDEEEYERRHSKRSGSHHRERSHHADPRIEKKHFWRDHNDDDNPTYPELRRPPKIGNADIDQTESDVPNLSKKEAEDFDRIVVQAKKEKEEKIKKEKEEKEKKDKEKKDDTKKSFSQTKH